MALRQHAAERLSTSRVRRELVAFVGVGLLVLVIITLGAVYFVGQVERRQVMQEDLRITSRLADFVFAPLLGAALAGDATRRGDLNRLVDSRMQDGTIVRINVWSIDGLIVYADDRTTIGQRFPVPDEVVDAIERGTSFSDISTEPETGPGSEPRQVEVYVPLRLRDRTLALEVYFSFQSIENQTAELTSEIVPPVVGALVLLQLVQVPIAVSLARRVRRHEADRTRLLERALSASERERKEIAAGIHDGVVQDLAGVGYAIGALSHSVAPENRAMADRLGATVRGAVDALRRLMVDIYPPDLSGSGLATAVNGLVTPLRDAGIEVQVQIEPLPVMDSEVAAALYRTTRETLTNVVKHAEASTVEVFLGVDDDPRWNGCTALRLRVADDGVGATAVELDRRSEGHLGLTLLSDRIADLGGELTITGGPAGGLVAEARVPAQAAR